MHTCDAARGTYSLAILPTVHSLTSSALTLSALAPQVLLKSVNSIHARLHRVDRKAWLCKSNAAGGDAARECVRSADRLRTTRHNVPRSCSLAARVDPPLDGLVDGAWRARAREMLGENARFGSCLFTDSPPVTNFHTATTAVHRKISKICSVHMRRRGKHGTRGGGNFMRVATICLHKLVVPRMPASRPRRDAKERS